MPMSITFEKKVSDFLLLPVLFRGESCMLFKDSAEIALGTEALPDGCPVHNRAFWFRYSVGDRPVPFWKEVEK